MGARTSWENKNEGYHRHCEDCGCSGAANLEPSEVISYAVWLYFRFPLSFAWSKRCWRCEGFA